MSTKLAYSKLEFSKETSLSVRKIDYLIQHGKLEAFKVGTRVLIPARAFETLLKGVSSNGKN